MSDSTANITNADFHALDYALAYARAGLAVLPLTPHCKTPEGRLAPHGKDDATTDPAQINDWWRRSPEANIGVRPSVGMLVVDTDVQHDGHVEKAKLEAEHGALPPTWTANTGSGGTHQWFWATGPFRGQLRAGIDLKCSTGYLVMPPSIHPTGRRYEWANNQPIALAPQWLLRLACKPVIRPRSAPIGQFKGTGGPLVLVVAQAQSGNRNRALFWAACRAQSDGILDQIRPELVEAARGIGLPDIEIDRTITSAAQKGSVA